MTERNDTTELATGYTTSNQTQFDAALFLLQRLKISPGSHILDVGCGPGNLTQHMQGIVGSGGKVVGIDPSAQRISIANQAASENVSYHLGIAEDLSQFPPDSFDFVFVNSTLHWVKDQPMAIKEFSRVLKPRGRLGISGGSGDFVAIHEQIKEDVLSREPFREYPESGGPHFLKSTELRALLEAAEFTEIDMVTNSIVKWAANSDDMIDWLDTSSSGQTYGGIPLHLRPAARAEMTKEWQKVTTEEGIHMKMDLLVTVAKKSY